MFRMIQEYAKEVFETLGPGFSESVYHTALETLLRIHNIQYESERVIPVMFKNHVVGHVRSDIIVDDTVVELKSVKNLKQEDIQQTLMYMRLLDKPKGILINFGSKFEVLTL
jgi:GxxExxY protein